MVLGVLDIFCSLVLLFDKAFLIKEYWKMLSDLEAAAIRLSKIIHFNFTMLYRFLYFSRASDPWIWIFFKDQEQSFFKYPDTQHLTDIRKVLTCLSQTDIWNSAHTRKPLGIRNLVKIGKTADNCKSQRVLENPAYFNWVGYWRKSNPWQSFGNLVSRSNQTLKN